MTLSDAFNRLHAMISDKHGKWDLSPNDVESLRAVYGEVARLRLIEEQARTVLLYEWEDYDVPQTQPEWWTLAAMLAPSVTEEKKT